MGRVSFPVLVSALAVLMSSCVGPGLLTDGSSVSLGTTSTGALRAAAVLPFRGDGYQMPNRWRERQRNYGTEELVQLLVRVARRISAGYHGSLLSIADLSPRGGGPSPEHKSHRSGRDVDLIFYHADLAGKPVDATEMVGFDEQGLSVQSASLPASQPTRAEASPQVAPLLPRRLDLERTWELVRTLITDPKVPVQWIFLGRPIMRLLLDYARQKGEASYVIERAATVMQHAPAHMDHMHVRVFCAPADRGLGCIDRGPARWLKKYIKYVDLPTPPVTELPRGLARLYLRPLRLLGL